jgi:uncharacterized protein
VAKRGFQVFDCDLHLYEPFDLWERKLPEPWRSRTRIAAPPRGHLEMSRAGIDIDGKVAQPVNFGGGRSSTEEKSFYQEFKTAHQVERRWANDPILAKAALHCEPDVYLEGMAVEGIDVALLMPSFTFRLTSIDGIDPEHAGAICRVYNDWAAEFASSYPDRFRFWAWLPRGAPAEAAREARRAVEELGVCGVAMTNQAVDSRLMTDPAFEPLWEEIERLHTVLGIHPAAPKLMRDDILNDRYRGHRRTNVLGTTMRPFYAQTTVAELILGGVLEAHPELRVMIMESSATWVPWLLYQMDEKWEVYGPDEDYTLSLPPSDYFRRQCYVAADSDEASVKYVIDAVGDDHVLWGSDYPHHDCPFPDATKHFLDLEGTSDASKRKILWDNPQRLFGAAAREGAVAHAG